MGSVIVNNSSGNEFFSAAGNEVEMYMGYDSASAIATGLVLAATSLLAF